MSNPRVLLLCGGQSEEHEVSLSSARSVIAAAGSQFEITSRVIDKTGKLLPSEASLQALSNGPSTATQNSLVAVQNLELQHIDPKTFDVVFPLLHGPYGEDGTIQGMLKLMGLPFVGSDVLGSAVGMDKLMMKTVFGAHGFPQVSFTGVNRKEWLENPAQVLEKLESLAFPLFVKPANLGSSVGISKAKNVSDLKTALDEAVKYDRRIIVEAGLAKPRELEVAILGNDTPKASPVGEISYNSEFYDYETKYTEGRAELDIPAKISTEIARECQHLALAAFKAIDAAGLARVDFFYDGNNLYINEINTMPGFTTTSMYPKLWEAAGISYAELIRHLIQLALERSP
jgi:D-alanine-D-alanine ligase